jgi:uncharacterized damage-inducible protein DinB
MSSKELDSFIGTWEHEAKSTLKLLRTLPANQYDFRPDAGGRSLGELAWHLAEIEGYIGLGAVAGKVDFGQKIPGLERPRTVAELASGYERVHAEMVAKVRTMSAERFDQPMPFMDRTLRTGDVLWFVLLHHEIHHRGQLVLMCRLAGGVPPGMFGPTREEMAARAAR